MLCAATDRKRWAELGTPIAEPTHKLGISEAVRQVRMRKIRKLHQLREEMPSLNLNESIDLDRVVPQDVLKRKW